MSVSVGYQELPDKHLFVSLLPQPEIEVALKCVCELENSKKHNYKQAGPGPLDDVPKIHNSFIKFCNQRF